jgi:hypothetical protein
MTPTTILAPLSVRPRTIHTVTRTRTGAVRSARRHITLAMLTGSPFGPIKRAAAKVAREDVDARLAASQDTGGRIIAMFRAPRQDDRTRGDDVIGGGRVG